LRFVVTAGELRWPSPRIDMMKAGAAAVGFAVVVAGGAVWAWGARPAATIASPAKAAAPIEAVDQAAPAIPADGRLFLTKDQLAQAMATGTLDRPVKSLLAVERPMYFGDYQWNDRGVPAGPTWIRIDLGTQLISVFRAGHEIGTAVIVYGGDNKETPSGTLHVLGKAKDHRSSLYDAQMPYTLRLTNDGVSIHASDVRWGAATHGCIGVPLAFAQRLFNAATVGDEVTVVSAGARPFA
jgi:lipoprotein-anchoring transpeptidase ErfK/SrfK